MIELSALKNLKEENEKIIAEKNAIIETATAEKNDLEAENRVLDKLIKLCEPTENI